MANDGGTAATVHAEVASAKGLAAKWAVIDKWGLRQAAERHMDSWQRIVETNMPPDA